MSEFKKIIKYDEKKYEKYVKESKLQDLYSLKTYLDDIYYNTSENVSKDSRYDLLKKRIINIDPNYIHTVGATLREDSNRVNLPYWLGSASKITSEEENELDRWFGKNICKSFIITEKLDGVSGMFICKDGKTNLYTRGDGIIGADISYLIKYISNIPKVKENIAVRGELIIEKEIFNKKYKKSNRSSGEGLYKHSRNMIAGLIGSKIFKDGLIDIKFIVYEIIGNDLMMKPIKQLKKLKNLGFTTAMYEKNKLIHSGGQKSKNLLEAYNKFKENTKFEIDGIIVQSNTRYDRNIDGNPSYLFAFKTNSSEGIIETVVLDVEWSVSKWGQIIPVAIIDPVELPGVTISRVTLSNAGLMVEKMIGLGSIINVTRSNEVIPYIVNVVKKCEEKDLKFPNIKYIWDNNKVHLNVIDPTSDVIDEMKIKLISSFFSKMSIKHVSEQTVTKLYKHGLNTLILIIGATKKEILKVPSFKEKSAERIYENIKKGLTNVKTPDLLAAYGIFGMGIGKKKISLLMNDIPDILSISKKELKDRIINVEGFNDISIIKICDNIEYAINFIDDISKYVSFVDDTRVSNDLVGKKYCFSGFRNKDLENEIINRGGKIATSISKKTTGLIVPDKENKTTGKSLKAIECGVSIYTKEEFLKIFLSSVINV